jgi:hypothetical protein
MSANTLWDDLENERGERPEYWKPAIGDSLRGTLVDVQEVDDTYNEGKKSVLLLVRDEAGQLWSWFPPTAPRRTIVERFMAGIISVGGAFGAKRLDDVKLKNGSMMKNFAIVPKPTEEDAQARAKRIMESRKAELGEEPEEKPARKAAAPGGAQPVESRTEVHPADHFEDDIPF